MSNGLFIRSYPAPGAQVVPANYRVSKAYYFLLPVGVPLLVAIFGPRHFTH